MLYINFSAPINERTSQALMNLLTEQLNSGKKEFYFLFASPGGNVRDGVTLHNFIRSLPAKIIMHNIGIVDSIGNVVFLAAEERYANPHSSFLFHGVGFDVSQPIRLEEKNLKERLNVIQRDQKIITDIIAERTRLGKEETMEMFFEVKTKTSEDAKEAGIVQDVKLANIPAGSRIVSLQF